MNFESDKWNKADLAFNYWLKGSFTEKGTDHINIVTSTFLSFREKELERLKKYCISAFEFFLKSEDKDFERDPRFLRTQKAEDEIVRDSEVRYSKVISPDIQITFSNFIEERNDKIIQGILSGDQQVFNDLYEHEFPKTVRLVTYNSGRVDDAKEVFQNGLVVIIEKVYRKELDLTCSFSTYLYSVCRNLWFEEIRRSKKTISVNDPYDYLQSDGAFISNEYIPDELEAVNKAIESLGDGCKQLLECFYYKNLSFEEIANTLGYATAASARNQKYKCLERIRRTVKVEVE